MTDPERFARLQQLFDAVADLPPQAREDYLVAHDVPSDLRVALSAMIAADRLTSSPLDQPLIEHVARLSSSMPASIGPYRLERLLGEGGMGVVYLGHRDDLGSNAAIKILRDAWLSPARRNRFQLEQRTLAQLNHPSIARLFDADTLPDGTPWFAMEYVEGVNILAYADAHQLNEPARLRLMLEVARAVQHAHQRAVIHRDLKPSNILVSSSGQVKLLDFGIARHLDDTSDPTVTALRLMTPAYAAPEQIHGQPVGVYTDIYSLGIILGELLPARRSRDLTALIGRATAPEADHRYPSADAFIRDIERYLAGEPLEARPASVLLRTGRFIRRHLLPVLALLAIAALSVYYTVRLAQARNEAINEANRSGRIRAFLVNLFEGGDLAAGPSADLRVATLLDRGVAAAHSLEADAATQAELYRTLGGVYQKLGQLDRADSLYASALSRRKDVETLNGLALLRADQARPDDSIRLAREALELARRQRDVLATGRTLTTLGHALEEAGKYDEARPPLEQALALLTAPDTDRATALVYLGNVHFYTGRYPESRLQNERALAIFRDIHGPNHPLIAEVLINLAAIEQETGNYAAAEAQHRKALAIFEPYYGSNHPKTASSKTLIARALVLQKKLDESAFLLQDALAIRERVYGPTHPQVASTVNELGTNALLRENLTEAEGHYRRMIAIYEKTYPGAHYLKGIAKSNLASVFMRRNEWRAAEHLFRDSLAIYASTLPPGHINEGIGRIKLGRTLLRQNRLAEARRELELGKKIVGSQANPAVSWLNSANKDLEEIKAAGG
jgi:serine/threonine-protein kinase